MSRHGAAILARYRFRRAMMGRSMTGLRERQKPTQDIQQNQQAVAGAGRSGQRRRHRAFVAMPRL
jgi:hypothetical protein